MRAHVAVAYQDATAFPVYIHQAIPVVPPPGPPTYMPHVEIPVTQWWPVGLLNHVTTNVVSDGAWVTLGDHSCGCFIPHVPFAPSLRLPVVICFSSRDPLFAASSSVFEGTPVACGAPFPMLTCGDPIDAPTSISLASMLSTMTVGVTFQDIVNGLKRYAVRVAIGILVYYMRAAIYLLPGRETVMRLGPKFLRKFLSDSLAGLVVKGARVFGLARQSSKVWGGSTLQGLKRIWNRRIADEAIEWQMAKMTMSRTAYAAMRKEAIKKAQKRVRGEMMLRGVFNAKSGLPEFLGKGVKAHGESDERPAGVTVKLGLFTGFSEITLSNPFSDKATAFQGPEMDAVTYEHGELYGGAPGGAVSVAAREVSQAVDWKNALFDTNDPKGAFHGAQARWDSAKMLLWGEELK